MKNLTRLVQITVAVSIAYFVFAAPVLASGDKVHGARSVGPSYQLGNCPFGR